MKEATTTRAQATGTLAPTLGVKRSTRAAAPVAATEVRPLAVTAVEEVIVVAIAVTVEEVAIEVMVETEVGMEVMVAVGATTGGRVLIAVEMVMIGVRREDMTLIVVEIGTIVVDMAAEMTGEGVMIIMKGEVGTEKEEKKK